MDREKLRDLAAEVAQGTAEPAEQGDFAALLAQADREIHQEIAQIFDTAALLSIRRAETPPPGLKAKVLANITKKGGPNTGFGFIPASDAGWQALPVPGAYLKLLSINEKGGYAVVLGKLDPGSRYPSHQHIGQEEILVLSGDLVIEDARGNVKLKAGDFHQAAAGSAHGVNYSETGCVILAILSQADLQRQMDLLTAAS